MDAEQCKENEPIKPYHRFTKGAEEYALDNSLHLWSRECAASTGYSPWILRKCFVRLTPAWVLEEVQKATVILGYEYKGVVADGPDNG